MVLWQTHYKGFWRLSWHIGVFTQPKVNQKGDMFTCCARGDSTILIQCIASRLQREFFMWVMKIGWTFTFVSLISLKWYPNDNVAGVRGKIREIFIFRTISLLLLLTNIRAFNLPSFISVLSWYSIVSETLLKKSFWSLFLTCFEAKSVRFLSTSSRFASCN